MDFGTRIAQLVQEFLNTLLGLVAGFLADLGFDVDFGDGDR